MTITQNNSGISFKYQGFNKLKHWIRQVIKEESFTCGDITIVFTSDEELARINKKYLGKDYFTDIITFDYSEDGLISGDIMISIDRVRENAVNYKVSEQKELDRVIIHGILHLCGYNDGLEEDIVLMRKKEEQYLEIRGNYC